MGSTIFRSSHDMMTNLVILFFVCISLQLKPVLGSKCVGYGSAPLKSLDTDSIPVVNEQAAASIFQNVTIEGIVVADLRNTAFNGYYIQAPASHHLSPTESSQAIFVYCGSGCEGTFSEGFYLRIKGVSSIFSTNSQLVDVTVLSILCETPKSVINSCPRLCHDVNVIDLSLPIPDLDDYIKFKGMLVHLTETMTVTNSFDLRFGEIGLSQGGRLINPTMQVEPGTQEYAALADKNNRRFLSLDDHAGGSCPIPQLYFNPSVGLRTGWTISSDSLDATVVLFFFSFRNLAIWKLIPTSFGKDIVSNSFNQEGNPRQPSVSPFVPVNTIASNLRIGSMNMLNFFIQFIDDGCDICRGADDLAEYNLQSTKLYAALQELDAAVVGLQEVQNLLADKPVQQMVKELNSFIGEAGKYDFIKTGNIGNDAIKNAIIYQPGLINPVGSPETLTFVDPVDKSRPSLAQTFIPSECGYDQNFTFVVNHFKSKGSECDEDTDPRGTNVLRGEGNCGFTRLKHAQQLTSWLAGDPTSSGSANFVLVGDFNSHSKERALKHLTASGFVDLAERDIDQPYSLSFSGVFGALDYMLVSSQMADSCNNTYEWHINSDEPIITDYNQEQYRFPSSCSTKPPSYQDTSPFRSSDHDPIVTSCAFVCQPESTSDDPTTYMIYIVLTVAAIIAMFLVISGICILRKKALTRNANHVEIRMDMKSKPPLKASSLGDTNGILNPVFTNNHNTFV